MLSQSGRIRVPVVGFAVGLLMTCGLADAGPGPVRSGSFDQRFSGVNALATAVDTKEGVNDVSPPNPSWVVQLIGDSSEAVAVSRFRELQNKHKLLLGMYKSVVLNTAITPGSEPIWTRIRVELSSREAAESLCSKLEAAGARCVVQRSDAGTSDANHAVRQPERAAPASALNGSLSPYQASPQQPSPQAQVRPQQQGLQQAAPAITIITPGATAPATAPGGVTTGVITGVGTTSVTANAAVGAAVSLSAAAFSRRR